MLKNLAIVIASSLVLAACASNQPHVIQASPNAPNIYVSRGMATQVEMPDAGRVQSVVVGNPNLVTAEQAGSVVNLVAKGDPGETNLIIRSLDDSNDVRVYQYHLTVQ